VLAMNGCYKYIILHRLASTDVIIGGPAYRRYTISSLNMWPAARSNILSIRFHHLASNFSALNQNMVKRK